MSDSPSGSAVPVPVLWLVSPTGIGSAVRSAVAKHGHTVQRVGLPLRDAVASLVDRLRGDLGNVGLLEYLAEASDGLAIVSYDDIRVDGFAVEDPDWDLYAHYSDRAASEDPRVPPAGAITISVKTSKLPANCSTATEAMQRYDFKILKYADTPTADLKCDVEVQVYREDEIQVSNQHALSEALTRGADHATIEALLVQGLGATDVKVALTVWAGRLDILRMNARLLGDARAWRYGNKYFWVAPLRSGRSIDTLPRHLNAGLARRSSDAVGSS